MKLFFYPEWNHEQLFDLTTDPTELRNLVGDPNYRDELQTMRRKLAEWRQRAR